MNKTLIILGSGFDRDLGLRNSCLDFSNSHYCPILGNTLWSTFEETLRNEVIDWYNKGMVEQRAKSLNMLWSVYTKNISWFFTEKSDEFKLDKDVCAYKFLKHITRNSRIYTFNYTDPNDYIDFTLTNDIIFLHGRHYRDTFKKKLAVMSQKNNIILGIDSCIPKDGIDNPHIYPLVKRNHPKYKETNIVSDLLNAENVIFYGFSMGIVDYGYFEIFFQSICNNKSNVKNIFYVTLNEEGLNNFYDNLKVAGIDHNILREKVSLTPIYTVNGANDKQFCNMLNIL